jgi:S-adenosylmethionine decarboxylase
MSALPDAYADVDRQLRAMIASVLGLELAAVHALPADTPLLTGPLGLRSIDGARLLDQLGERFGVDVAAEDLALESLETIATLVAFVAERCETQSALTPGDEADPTNLASYAIDLWVDDPHLLTDSPQLVAIMRQAAERGHAVVLAECAHTFPNGAVTAVLVLSQSHLSVHTWPELNAANFDLLTCGRLNGERMIATLEAALEPTRMNVTRLIRDVVD